MWGCRGGRRGIGSSRGIRWSMVRAGRGIRTVLCLRVRRRSTLPSRCRARRSTSSAWRRRAAAPRSITTCGSASMVWGCGSGRCITRTTAKTRGGVGLRCIRTGAGGRVRCLLLTTIPWLLQAGLRRGGRTRCRSRGGARTFDSGTLRSSPAAAQSARRGRAPVTVPSRTVYTGTSAIEREVDRGRWGRARGAGLFFCTYFF